MITFLVSLSSLLILLKEAQCEVPTEPPKNISAGDCVFGKSSEQPKLIYNNETAVLKVEFPSLPSSCNFGSYHIIIISNLTELPSQPTDCPDHSFAIHSERYVKSDAVVLAATFRYVYTGFYCIAITPKEQSNSRKPYYQVASFQTNIPSPHISKWNTTLFVEPNGRERSVRIRFTNGPPAIDFERFRVHMRSVTTSCDEVDPRNSKFARDTDGDKLDVTFTDLEPGTYCVFVQPLDERCHPDRVWGDTRSCLRHRVAHLVLAPEATERAMVKIDCTTSRDMTILVSAVIAVALLISAIVYYAAARRNLFGLIWPRGSALEVGREKNDSDMSFPSKWDNCYPVSVLILYAGEDESFQKRIEGLKDFLNRKGKCKIYDIYDEDQYQDIAVLGSSWVTSLVCDQKIRILIVTSPEAVDVQESLIHGKQRLRSKEPHPFDKMFVQGIKEVMDLIARDGSVYERVFLARFSDVLPLEPVLSFVSPFTLFSLPKHSQSLVKHLHGLNELDEYEPLMESSPAV